MDCDLGCPRQWPTSFRGSLFQTKGRSWSISHQRLRRTSLFYMNFTRRWSSWASLALVLPSFKPLWIIIWKHIPLRKTVMLHQWICSSPTCISNNTKMRSMWHDVEPVTYRAGSARNFGICVTMTESMKRKDGLHAWTLLKCKSHWVITHWIQMLDTG